MIVSGRLRDLADKLLFGQAYPLHVEATRHPIRITVDGEVVLEADGPVVDWTFDPRLPAFEPGPHRITVTGDGTEVSWTVIKSQRTDVTERAIYMDSIEFRETYGLNADPAYVHDLMHDPALEQNFELFWLPVTDDELDVVELFEDPGEPWGEMVSYAEGHEPPPRETSDPFERYLQTEAVDVYAGSYIDGGKLNLGFTRDADKHLEELRRRTTSR